MKHKLSRAGLLAGFLFAAGLAAHAQTQPSGNSDPSNNSRQPPEGEPIQHSPFVVQDSKDVGYQASSTLAGTRLNSDIGDLGVPVSVVTKEFLDDTGVMDINQIFLYTVSTEGSGVDGNFTGTSADSTGFVDEDDVRRSPQTSTRVRGLGAADLTRNYFLTDMAVDSYNIERVDISRGPNAILFGLGSPAGVANSTLLKANYQRNRTRVKLRYGDNNSARESVDTNYILVPKKLAVRIAALHEMKHWEQNPSFQRQNRVFATVTANPFKDTTFTASYENGRVRARRPMTVASGDNMTTWFMSGNPSWNSSVAGGLAVYPQFPPAGNTDPIFDRPGNLYNNPNFYWQLAVPYNYDSQTPLFAGFQGKRTAAASNPITGAKPSVLNFNGALNLGNFSSTLAYQGLPPSVFNFKQKMLGWETGYTENNFNAFNAALEQGFFNNQLGLEIAYDHEMYRDYFDEPFGKARTNTIFIDVNNHLMDGRVNPNFGRPFMLSWESGDFGKEMGRDAVRATAYAKFDAADHFTGLGRWLGRHTLTLFGSQQKATNFNQNTKLGWVGDNIALNMNENSLVQQRRNVVNLFYVGPSLAQFTAIDQVHLDFNLTARPTRAGDYRELTYWDRKTQTWKTGPFEAVQGVSSASRQRDEIKSSAAVLQSYWLRDNLVTTVGWREDRSTLYASPAVMPLYSSGRYEGSVNLGELNIEPSPREEIGGRIWTYSGVAKLPRQIKLPFGIRPTVHYSQSENFQPVSGDLNVFGDKVASPTGKTKEYGASISALEDRVNLRANWYETSLTNSRSSGLSGNDIKSVLIQDFQTLKYWYDSLNAGYTDVTQADIDRLVSTIPQSVKDMVAYQVNTTPDGKPYPTYNIPTSSLSDVTNYVAKGMEIEATMNITRQWRAMFNVARQRTMRANTAPFIDEYIALRNPIWKELGNIKLNPSSVSNETLYQEVNKVAIGGVLGSARANDGIYSPEMREWRANFVTNYNFAHGFLKGVGLGGADRWQDRAVLDYPRIVRPDGIIAPDLDHPFYTPATNQVDLWVSYRRKLFKRSVDWKIQLNISNVFAHEDFMPATLNADGTTAVLKIAPQRSWSITSSFDF